MSRCSTKSCFNHFDGNLANEAIFSSYYKLISLSIAHFPLSSYVTDYREPIVLGWLEVSINYDETQDTLYCTLLRARDLPPMDSQGLSDPFCKVNIITAENTLRHTRWQKSRIAHKTNNPEFNETFTFMGMSFEDMTSSSLFVVLLDDDKYGNDFLGATKISMGLVRRRKRS